MKRLMKFSVTQSVVLMLFLPIMGSMIILGSFYFYFNKTRDDVLFTNIAGQQRMLSEQLGSYVHMVHEMGQEEDREPLRELVANFDSSLTVLDQGGEIMGRRLSPSPPEIRDKIYTIKQLWTDLKPALLLVADQPITSPQVAKANDFIHRNIPRLRDISNEIVSGFESLDHNYKRRILRVVITVLSLNLVLLFSGIMVTKRYLKERKRTEEILRQSEEEYRTLFELGSDAFLTFLPMEGKIVDANKATINMLGYSKEELRKLSGNDIIAPTVLEETERKRQRQVEKQGHFLLETIWVRKDGSQFPVEVSGKPFELGGQLLYQLIGRDITERKRLEAIVRNIAEGISAEVGESFFNSLVSHLSNALHVDYAFVGSLSDDLQAVTTIALFERGKIKPNFTYDLKGTPCENVIGKELCTYSKNVAKLFPQDKLLLEMGVECYMGCPLFGAKDQPLGVLVIMDSKPFEELELTESLLRVFAVRAASELERKRAEEIRRENEEKMRRILASTPTVHYICQKVGDSWSPTFCSPNLEKLFGYNVNTVLGDCDWWGQNIHPNDREWVLAAFNSAIEEGKKHYVHEYRFRRANGEYFYVHDELTIIREAKGHPVEIIGSWLDITERKQAEKTMKESEERYRNLIDIAPIAIAIHQEGKWVLVNKYTIEMLGYETEAELLGQPVLDILHPDYRQPAAQRIAELARTGKPAPPMEEKIMKKDGSVVDIIVTAAPVTFQGKQAFEVAAIDISELKQTEKALKESEVKFRTIFEESRDAIILTTVDGQFVDFNQATERLLGYNREELLNLPVIEIYADKTARHPFTQLTASRGFVKDYELQLKKKDGTVITCLDTASVRKDGEGKIIGYQGIVRDITEHKLAEEEIRQSREQLRALATRLQAIREEERAKISRELHDELGHLMTALKIDLTSLLRDPLFENNPRASDLQSMISLTNDSLQIIKRISTELRPGVLDQLGLCAAIKWQLKEFQSRTHIKCEAQLPDERLKLDQHKDTTIFRIFQETLTNITRHAQATNVSVTLEKPEQSVVLTVKDNGRGIEESEIANIASLGILGMRERARLVGAELTITGEKGKGTTVSVSVPID